MKTDKEKNNYYAQNKQVNKKISAFYILLIKMHNIVHSSFHCMLYMQKKKWHKENFTSSQKLNFSFV